jgi:acylphosphatase
VVVARRVIVSGRVQGVWFRESCRRVADQAGVTGWVRNLDDGRVEAWLEGTPDAVAVVETWCETGPRHAMVTAVAAEQVMPSGHTSFRVVG